MIDTATLSAAAILQRLDAIEQDRKALEAQLVVQRKAARKGYIEQLRQDIRAHGYTVEEIALALLPKEQAQALTGSGRAGVSGHYVDPQDPSRTYVRGVLPGWLKEQMQAQGLDPENREQRRQFRQAHLQWVKD